MAYNEEAEIAGTTSDYLVERLLDKEHGQEYAVEYLKADFLTAAANVLFTLRRKAELTQTQVAERLHTKQSAIARLEGDFDGAMSLRRLVDFALACGYIPHHLTFAPLETALDFTVAQPQTSFTVENHLSWCNATFQLKLDPVSTTSQATFNVPTPVTTLREVSPNLSPQLSSIEARSQSLPLKESVAA
jgi:transcriptional regulator with XRE-family HTH domain